MKKHDIGLYDFNLPKSLIAQTPLESRDASKLLVCDTVLKKTYDFKFNDLTKFLTNKDILVLNNTKVIPARIYGIKEETNAKIEVLLLKELSKDVWQCLVRPQKRVNIGTLLNFNNLIKGQIIEKFEDGITNIKMIYEGEFYSLLDKVGIMPLPPYIHKKLEDPNMYQTVYAKNRGSVAAPTAGLHFTKELLNNLESLGVKILYVTLNVGLGTFRPVEVNDFTKHKMHTETYTIDKKTAEYLNKAKKDNKRIIAVGTTVVRTLESNLNKYGKFKNVDNEPTNIFIYPPYKVKSIDGLITNFHLPKSTLIMLVSSIMGRNFTLNTYKYAIDNNYRFFSFGDAMFITKHLSFNKIYKEKLEEFKSKNPYYIGSYFKVYKGTNNILVSAPHAGRHIRNNKNKIREYGTSKLAKLLNTYKNTHIIYTNIDYTEDANHHEMSEYKKYLYEYIRINNIKYFIDLHGIEKKYGYSVEIGTNKYANVFDNMELINQIISELNKNKIKKVIVDKKYKAGNKTLSGSIHNDLNIITIQLEINENFRKIHKRPRSFYKIVNSLIDIVDVLQKEG